MDQQEKREYLIRRLLDEQPRFKGVCVPPDPEEQKRMLRSLLNLRLPAPADDAFLRVQDAYLKEAIRQKGITELSDLSPCEEGLYLWQGDITTLRCDAIVNAANSGMTGCYQPCHACIDNSIHTYAGIQLRLFCMEMMEKQGTEEPTGRARITPAFNLPSRYVLHTVGPIVRGSPSREQEEQLDSCYRSCLMLAEENKLRSIAFCCISTGVFGFPKRRAAEIAVHAVRQYRREHHHEIEVIFDVFQDEDHQIYRGLLGAERGRLSGAR